MKQVLLAGASGLSGDALLSALLLKPDLEVTALVRQPLTRSARRLTSRVCNWARLDTASLPRADVAYCCLGSTAAAAGSRAAFRAVDVDLSLTFARAAKGAGVTCFVAVSAQGASAAAPWYYSRVKAEAEQGFMALGFASLVIVRPSLLIGDRRRLGQPRRAAEGLAQRLLAPLARYVPAPWRPIEVTRLARVMLAYGCAAPPGVWIVQAAELHARS